MANLTIYQRLGKLFGPGGPTKPEISYQKFKVGPQDILKQTQKMRMKRKVANATIFILI